MNIVDTLVLKGLKGIGDGSIIKLLEFTSSQNIKNLEELAEFGIKNLPLRRTSEALENYIAKGEFRGARLATEDKLGEWGAQGITAIHCNSSQYPKRLLDLKNPPPFLFCKGNLSLLDETRAIAVVGTRNNTGKGAQITTKTVEAFHARKFVIVSGLALGIDTIAHRSALDCRAPTIAVLVDLIKISPASNTALSNEIIQNNGLLIAENIPGTPTIAALFAKRDRIQTGLSTAVFAIETSIDGGTMHAVNAAKELHRPVFVPDAIAARYSDTKLEVIQGTQYLVERGEARPYTSAQYENISEELEAIALRLRGRSASMNQKGLQI